MHLTIRMAWHDNNWDGKVCCNPEGNTYCTGAHSLLSGRIEKKKNTELEQGLAGEYINDKFNPANVPPCYWSINAFSDREFPVEHHHAFKWVKSVIPDVIKKNSVITWPFKLSFVHSSSTKEKKHGNYWPDLNQRIHNYINKFKTGQSIIFFYANYDNPVSADDMKYLLVGCSVVSELPVPKHFEFTKEKLAEIRTPKTKKKKVGTKWVEYQDLTMTNFPTMNWMLQFSHDPDKAVVLPYREYVKYAETNPEQGEEYLNEIKVIIEEESLVRGFKYVSMDIDDDKCLYLLYKLRKSIKKIQEHNQQVVKRDLKIEDDKIRELIEMTWKKRGTYPSLNHVLNYFIQDQEIANTLSTAIKPLLSPKHDLVAFFESILEEECPDKLENFTDELDDLSRNRILKKHYRPIAKLALLQLTSYQINKIIDDKDLLKAIEMNPYILYEDYVADEDDLDVPDMQDERIEVFKVDMGMIPDRKFVERHKALQNLTEDSPERVRSVIIDYLWHIGTNGHCYDTGQAVLDDLKNHPLIYKNDIRIDEEAILKLDDDYRSHFIEKLHIKETKEANYFYLDVVKKSESFIKSIVDNLTKRADHKQKQIDIDKHIKESLVVLENIVKTKEQKEQFTLERQQLYKNIFSKSFFLLTGKPGAGKTYETSKIIEHLYNAKEDIVVLAPTGKAALRLSENIKKYTALEDIKAETIDRFIFNNKFGELYDDWESGLSVPEEDKLTIENLIIDECSMLDINKLTLLLSIIKLTAKYPKRIILVGDENQLPPIGFGKPFHDVIEFIQSNDNLSKNHYINLVSNCRQENDEMILKLADAFTDKTRCYEEAFNIINSKEGKQSDGLFLYKWKNKNELYEKINQGIETVFNFELKDVEGQSQFSKMNLLFGLYDSGRVNNQNYAFKETLALEKFQVLSPYRTGYFGTLGVNKLIQDEYRQRNANGKEDKYFKHSDKIIRINNWYEGYNEKRKLKLSNGSIGVVTVTQKKYDSGEETREYEERKFYFRDYDYPMPYVDDEENFDLAYAITVHKAQGSDFKNVFLVVPQKQALLSKELLYTALTRSKFRLFLFVQDVDENLLMKAKHNSHLIHRNTSIFTEPVDKKSKYVPEAGTTVSSKIEFIIFNALQRSGLNFKYEEPLKLDKLSYLIHPDFTIYLRDGTRVFWEHLGMLDTRKYYRDWQDRLKNYREHGIEDILITTDDLNGVRQEKIDELIEHLKERTLKTTKDNKFSMHHYTLY